ncbi:hypothetical protein MTAT_19280 [Moorella thermoacetica]|uniref:Uncharacterized protein n=1 Tax=Neomoorella thermoacetica TaxID=1525 RepID=A0AAC9MV94_NEOTH|nr:DUF6744 family protein [Moorella thermoacetica]AOQ24585.1 hypothetical protein Maut_02155 [Moorella thermoacetica]TYL12686.1 hypothetical protein MTAT_19280 [Moorella thermoacetica]
MAQNKINLQNKVVVPNAGRFLGKLCWFTIHGDIDVSRDRLEEIFVQTGMDLKYMPPPIRPVDVFRRATSRVEKYDIPYKKNHLNILVREVKSDKDQVVRQLVLEEVDSQNVRLFYTTAASLTFDRNHGTIVPQIFNNHPAVFQAADEALALYKTSLDRYQGIHIRRMVGDILKTMKPTSVRPSGGVFFVPAVYNEDLDKLQEVVRALRSEFFNMPVVDTVDTREMICDKLHQQINATLSVLAETLKNKDISSKKVNVLVVEAKDLLDQVKEYESLLQQDLSGLKEKIDLVKMQMVALLEAA